MNQEVSSSSSSEGSSDDTGSDFSDTESDGDVIGEEETKCLFCDTGSNSPEECLVHIKLVHDLDIV